MRLIKDDTILIETILSGFLRSSADPRSNYNSVFWTSNTPILCPDGEIIQYLSTSPSKELKVAWSKQIESSAIYRLLPIASKNQIIITPSLTALAIVAYNFIKILSKATQDKKSELITLSGLDYSLQLCSTIPPAADPLDGIIYDSLIEPCCKLWRKKLPETKADNSFLVALLRINPFSELKNLDLQLPAPLKYLAGSYLTHQEKENQEYTGLSEADMACDNNHQMWWLLTEKFILNPPLMRVLRDQWLSIPENSLCCMGLGIFLEELRRRGKKDFRTPILEFFEAYDYMQRHQIKTDGTPDLQRKTRYQRLTIIQHLLESKNRKLNRKGNEYFLKFRALLEIIAEEQAIPSKFRHLSREFCLQRLAPLSALATVIGGERTAMAPSFGAIQYSDQPENN